MAEYKYGLTNRPAGIGCVPKGDFRLDPPISTKEGRDISRHGVVVFDRALTDDEIYSFELTVIVSDEVRESLVNCVAKEMQDYAADYLEDEKESPDDFRIYVASALKGLRPYRLYVGEIVHFVAAVKARLVDFVQDFSVVGVSMKADSSLEASAIAYVAEKAEQVASSGFPSVNESPAYDLATAKVGKKPTSKPSSPAM